MVNKLWSFLQGKKTYLTALGMIVYALLGLYLGYLTQQQAAMYIFAALGMIGFRSAMNK